MRIEYAEQAKPAGIAQAFLIGAEFIGGSGVSLILGDNIFYGNLDFFREALAMETGACIFGYKVRDPERYGVVEFDARRTRDLAGGKAGASEEPLRCAGTVCLRQRGRGNLPQHETLRARRTGDHRRESGIPSARRFAGADARPRHGVAGHRHAAKSFWRRAITLPTIEHRQGLKVACVEEIAFANGFIDTAQFDRLIASLPKSEYREYLQLVAEEKKSER